MRPMKPESSVRKAKCKKEHITHTSRSDNRSHHEHPAAREPAPVMQFPMQGASLPIVTSSSASSFASSFPLASAHAHLHLRPLVVSQQMQQVSHRQLPPSSSGLGGVSSRTDTNSITGSGDIQLPSLANVPSFRKHFAFNDPPLQIKRPPSRVFVPGSSPSPLPHQAQYPSPVTPDPSLYDQFDASPPGYSRKRKLGDITQARPGHQPPVRSVGQTTRQQYDQSGEASRQGEEKEDNEEEEEEDEDAEEAEEDEGETSPSTRTSRSKKEITLDMLRPYFEQPIATVAAELGVCKTVLKKLCRKQGIVRWPARQLRSLRKSIESMENAIGLFNGEEKAAYLRQLAQQQQKLELLRYDPTLVEDDEADSQNIRPSPTAHHNQGNETSAGGHDQLETASSCSSPGSASSSKRPRQSSTRSYSQCIIQLDMLRSHFDKPLNEAARLLGVCPSVLKKICRENGLLQWPYRPLLSIRKSIKSVQTALANCTNPQEKRFFEQQLAVHQRKCEELLHPERKRGTTGEAVAQPHQQSGSSVSAAGPAVASASGSAIPKAQERQHQHQSLTRMVTGAVNTRFVDTDHDIPNDPDDGETVGWSDRVKTFANARPEASRGGPDGAIEEEHEATEAEDDETTRCSLQPSTTPRLDAETASQAATPSLPSPSPSSPPPAGAASPSPSRFSLMSLLN